jgi:glycosyltransferase involved in cell wall biosynthesis
MRLVVTVPWGAALGGAEEMLRTFLARADRDRIDPTVVFFEPGPFERETASLGIRTAVVPTGRLREPHRLASAVRRLARLLRRERPGLVLNWTAKAQLYGAPAAALARMPERVVWWQHGVPAGQWMDRLATRLPACAVGCSSAASADAQRTLRPRRPAFVVHPGVPLPAEPLPKQTLPGVPAGRTVVGIVGRLQPWKGQERLLEAVSALSREGHDLHLLMVGGEAHGFSAGFESHLRSRVDALGMRDRATMTGHVEDVTPHLAAMDLLVNASDREPFGIVLLEAMAQGVPVLAVADAGPREIVVPGESGLLVPSSRSEALAEALRPLLGDPDLRRRLGAGGRERVRECFTAERMADRLQSQLERLAGGSPAASQPLAAQACQEALP